MHDTGLKATTVYVTHDQIEAMSLGDQIAVMSHGVPNSWARAGDPMIVRHRSSWRIYRLSDMNLMTFHDAQVEPGRLGSDSAGARSQFRRHGEGL